jgi:hypothetical protein
LSIVERLGRFYTPQRYDHEKTAQGLRRVLRPELLRC